MCGIGYMYSPNLYFSKMKKMISSLFQKLSVRGSDGFGLIGYGRYGGQAIPHVYSKIENVSDMYDFGNKNEFLLQCRGEPTTEMHPQFELNDKVAPFSLGDFSLVHNGTVANDDELRTDLHESPVDSLAILEQIVKNYESESPTSTLRTIRDVMVKIKGSYAVLIKNKNESRIYYAVNYKPLYVGLIDGVNLITSTQIDETFVKIPPYSYGFFELCSSDFRVFLQKGGCNFPFPVITNSLKKSKNKCLVVLSSGMDSTTALGSVMEEDYQCVEALHFNYGCKAQSKELECVQEICNHYGIKLNVMEMPKFNSPLTVKDGNISNGKTGVEYAHEWVPARNLVMLSLATAFAEEKGFTDIAVGTNLEESGAYPDNEPEFIKKFNQTLVNATNEGKIVRIIQPVGNLMKHQIVALAHELNVPLTKTWSCYHNGELHCGECGPCTMRKLAFRKNNLTDKLEYLK